MPIYTYATFQHNSSLNRIRLRHTWLKLMYFSMPNAADLTYIQQLGK